MSNMYRDGLGIQASVIAPLGRYTSISPVLSQRSPACVVSHSCTNLWLTYNSCSWSCFTAIPSHNYIGRPYIPLFYHSKNFVYIKRELRPGHLSDNIAIYNRKSEGKHSTGLLQQCTYNIYLNLCCSTSAYKIV